MTSGIYCYLNKINGKRYIGKSVDLDERKNSHERAFKRSSHKGTNVHLHASVRKYGRDNFEYSVIEIVNECDLRSRELFWIEHYNSHDRLYGYNIRLSLDGQDRISEETKKKMSDAAKGENNHFYGKHHSEETKASIAKTISGAGNPFYGRTHSEETKATLSALLSGENSPRYGVIESAEVRAKKSAALKGKKKSPEHVEKMRARTGELASNYGKQMKESTKLKLSLLRQGENNPMSKESIERRRFNKFISLVDARIDSLSSNLF